MVIFANGNRLEAALVYQTTMVHRIGEGGRHHLDAVVKAVDPTWLVPVVGGNCPLSKTGACAGKLKDDLGVKPEVVAVGGIENGRQG